MTTQRVLSLNLMIHTEGKVLSYKFVVFGNCYDQMSDKAKFGDFEILLTSAL